MELKKGMYVITTDRLEIGRIIGFCECEMCKERGFYEPALNNPNMFITNYDKERSFHGYKFYENLLDLIKVGDFITLGENHYPLQIRNIWEHGGDIHIELSNGAKFEDLHYNKDFKIYSIVTKEQFSSMEYRLGE